VAFATSATWLIRHWQARRKQFDIKRKGSPYSITECRVPELILVFGSQPAGDVSHKPGGGLPLLSARSDLHHFFVHVAYDRGSILLWRRSDMLCTSGFMDDAISQGCSTSPHMQLKRSSHAALGLVINGA